MAVKEIKNVSGSTKTYAGQQISDAQTYAIPAAEELAFASDTSLIGDIATGDVEVYKDAVLLTTAVGLQYIQNVLPPAITPTALPDPASFRFRGDATPWTTCAPGTTNLDLTMAEERYVDGGVVIVKDANPGDYCVFQVVHPIAGVVEQFVNKWYVIPGTSKMDVNVYRAKVPAGLIIRVVYNNVGGTNVECGINLRLHKAGT
jgi:hypothetical protein